MTAHSSCSQEIETAVRERIPLVVLIWEDGGYGLIEWKMDVELGDHYYVAFNNPDVVAHAESFGAKGYRITAADELLPTLKAALDDDGVSLISCPVDYSENLRLTERLGQLETTCKPPHAKFVPGGCAIANGVILGRLEDDSRFRVEEAPYQPISPTGTRASAYQSELDSTRI